MSDHHPTNTNQPRARRRSDLARMKAKARRLYGPKFGPGPDAARAERWANHLASCSCPMCGNPRRHFGDVTRQERRAALIERE